MDPTPEDHIRARIAEATARRLIPISTTKGKLVLPKATGSGTIRSSRRKIGRNEPCPCDSGKKFKKCHGATKSVYKRPESQRPKEKPIILGATVEETQQTTPPASKQATAQAMVNAKISRRFVWAYLETGLFVTAQNRKHHDEETLKVWDAALEEYDNATPDEQRILEVPAEPGEAE